MGDKAMEVEQLVIRARSGDVGAFEALYDAHQAGIYTFIRSQVRESELAADLTQDTFVRAWQSLSRLRAPGAFRGWLHRIAGNLVRDTMKSGRARLEVTESALAPEDGSPAFEPPSRGADSPEQSALSGEMNDILRAALMALPAEQRAAVVMHHVESMPVAEIAKAMHVRPGTIMSRLARAREALRKRLGPYLEGADEPLR